jgi:hypothetical protein
MKRLGIGGVAAILFALASLAQSSIDAEGVANGKTVLWFSGTEVSALIESDFGVGGTLEIEGTAVPFAALGTAFGRGIGDSAAMTLSVWIIIEATGATDNGDPVSIRGGIAGSSADADLSATAFGSAAGPFFFVVTLGTASYSALGTAVGSAAGAFVVPDDPFTMQMEGAGTYTLVGDLVADVLPIDDEVVRSRHLEQLPWDPTSWPPELFATLLAVLDGAVPEPSEEPEAEPADD